MKYFKTLQIFIFKGKELNFDKQTNEEVDTLGIMYDYGSIMHYSTRAFSRNGNPTIIPSRLTVATLGQRNDFSDRDLAKINKLYRCGKLILFAVVLLMLMSLKILPW